MPSSKNIDIKNSDIDYSPLGSTVSDQGIAQYKKLNDVNVYSLSEMAKFILIMSSFFLFCISGAYFRLYSIFFDFIYIFLVIIVWRLYKKHKYSAAIRVKRFTDKNNFQLKTLENVGIMKGVIFSSGHKQEIYEAISIRRKLDFEIANIKCTYRSYDENPEYEVRYGYAMIVLDKLMPHTILMSCKNAKLASYSVKYLLRGVEENQKISLEGDFDKYFSLYAPEIYRQDALYIFNPSVMSIFIEMAASYDIEIIDNYIFFYSNYPFNFANAKTIRNLIEMVDCVGSKLHSAIKNYQIQNIKGDRNLSIADVHNIRLKTNKHASVLAHILAIIIIILIVSVAVVNFIDNY